MWSQTVLLGILLTISLYLMHGTLAQNNTTSSDTPSPSMSTTSYYTTLDPTSDPTMYPTAMTTTTTSYQTTADPTTDPTYDPTYAPSYDPTYAPSYDPTYAPSYDPTYYPTFYPTFYPTYDPTYDPTIDPTMDPTQDPIATPRPTNYPTEEPTNEPTLEPTSEPTLEPTMDPIEITTTDIDTTSTTEEEDDDKKWRVKCRFILRLFKYLIRRISANAAEETTITDEEIQNILIATIEDQIDAKLDFDKIELTKTDDPDNTNYTIYTFDVEILTTNEDDANLVQDTIESEAFINELEQNLEEESGTTATAEAVVTDIEPPEEECKVTLWNPFTYQDCPDQILPWILLGAAGCILCVLIVCFCRCCYLCCTRSRRMHRKKSRYEVGGAMFAPIDSVNAEQESAFQSDLRTAIEMNKQGKLLKETQTSLDLDGDAVATAFDMDFDEIKPIKSSTNGTTKQKIKKATSADDDEKDTSDDDKQKTKGKKKGSEGAMPMTTGMTPGGPITPGGPTPGGPDDEDNPPPAPAPPLNQMTDYDLL